MRSHLCNYLHSTKTQFIILDARIKRFSNNVSLFRTEMMAILMSMQWVEESNPMSVVVCSESYSELNSLNSGKSAARQDILYSILQTCI